MSTVTRSEYLDDEAVQLILTHATTTMRASQNRSRRTRSAARQAAIDLFVLICGRRPVPAEIERMLPSKS